MEEKEGDVLAGSREWLIKIKRQEEATSEESEK